MDKENHRVLVIEDEPKSAGYLHQGLTESGFLPTVVGDGDDGLAHAQSGTYAVVILDVGIPKRDGWAVMAELRRAGSHPPVLFLTACDAIDDRVRGLELGADDYLVKPFAFSELLARLRSLVRRGQGRSHELLTIADLTVDVSRQRVMRAGIRLELTTTEFLLLSFLLRHTGEPITRRMLAEQVWDMRYDSETNVVEVGIRRLRAKVDDPFPVKVIHTVRGIGYVCTDKP